MSSIYERLLGDEFNRLHPKLQTRYQLDRTREFRAEGMMEEVSGGSKPVRWLLKLGVKFRIFFSERGRDIPFTIRNRVTLDRTGREVVHWDRTFHFGVKQRFFDAIMMLDDHEQEIIDLFGRPSLLGSTLSFHVDDEGAMHIASKKQWLPLMGLRVPLPTFLHGKAYIIESYDDQTDEFRIRVHVYNSLVGTLFEYKGSFREIEGDQV
ncbi:DUF4166 domain-containing protein [Paenibacillus pini]|uniref:DUF4166 domain-containing protein n=1 Tax=Paenibacillus pini JCM 16418 TaxID=1236976 RepID=W7YMY3_9BACL|nr:DUF4166 domain-containing protein [Paenibacillus pini]GAF09817.1 hypothetical protein JCM16418_3973 [Paenibacillus pini JCM 16418]